MELTVRVIENQFPMIVGIRFEKVREESPYSFKMRFCVSDSGDKRLWHLRRTAWTPD
jgi:hypothetical protein